MTRRPQRRRRPRVWPAVLLAQVAAAIVLVVLLILGHALGVAPVDLPGNAMYGPWPVVGVDSAVVAAAWGVIVSMTIVLFLRPMLSDQAQVPPRATLVVDVAPVAPRSLQVRPMRPADPSQVLPRDVRPNGYVGAQADVAFRTCTGHPAAISAVRVRYVRFGRTIDQTLPLPTTLTLRCERVAR